MILNDLKNLILSNCTIRTASAVRTVLGPAVVRQSVAQEPYFSGIGIPVPNYEQRAYAVSADGTIVAGQIETPAHPSGEAFTWTRSGGFVTNGDMPDGAYAGNAVAISANPMAAAGQLRGRSHAYRRTSAIGFLDLGDLPGGSDTSRPGVSVDGSAVVGSGFSGHGFEAFR